MNYQTEEWFAMLQAACKDRSRVQVSQLLGVSAPLLSQVLNASGKYGTGEAKTDRIGERVVHVFGSYECPHLTEQNSAPHVISAAECSVFAHRPAPVGSPRDMQHWQACNTCIHKGPSAPPVAREVKPRKPRTPADTAAADTAPASTTTPTEPNHVPV
jgi:hypothetical protein